MLWAPLGSAYAVVPWVLALELELAACACIRLGSGSMKPNVFESGVIGEYSCLTTVCGILSIRGIIISS